MKLLALASFALLCAGSTLDGRPAHRQVPTGAALSCWTPCNVDDAKVDEPPPLDCPMCGGNADLHRRRTEFLLEASATALLAVLTAR